MPDVIKLLETDHREVEDLFAKAESTTGAAKQQVVTNLHPVRRNRDLSVEREFAFQDDTRPVHAASRQIHSSGKHARP